MTINYEIEFWKTSNREQTIRLVKALAALREIEEVMRANDPGGTDFYFRIRELASEGQK